MDGGELRQGRAGALGVYDALRARGLSEKSARLYIAELYRIERAVAPAGMTLMDMSGAVLADYAATRPRSWSTQKLIRSSLEHYWQIRGRDDPPLWAIRVPRKPQMHCRALEPEDAAVLAKAARLRGDREGLAVLFGLYAGIRREEIAGVAWEDIKLDGWLRVFGKGGSDHHIPLHPALLHALSKHEVNGRWVFPGRRRDAHVVPTTVWTWIRRVAAEAGLRAVAPHVLRHTCLATANDNTGDLRAVQELARHVRPETTAGYTRAKATRMRAAVNSIDY